MTPFRRQILLKSLKLFDLVVACAGVLGAALVASRGLDGLSPSTALSMRGSVGDFVLTLGFLVVWHASFSIFGLYDSRRLSGRGAVARDVARAALSGTAVLALGATVFPVPGNPIVFVATLWIVTTLLAVSSRLALRLFLEAVRRRGRNLRHLVIVGLNDRTVRFARHIESRPELGYLLAGFVDDSWERADELQELGCKRIGTLADFSALLRENVIDEVVIGLPVRSFYAESLELTRKCEEQGVLVRLLSNIFDVRLAPARTDLFQEEMVLTVSRGSVESLPVLLKRMLDVALALAMLVLAAPLLLVAALAIRFSSRGPVLFVQERVGLNKRVFKLLKFRTMEEGAEDRQDELEPLNEVKGPVFKIKDDPRITGLGHFLRRTSIDELPQLINVLKGDMSLVGPRPLPIRDYSRFSEDWHRRRFSVRPGLTCLWQVNGRASVPFEQWMRLDMQYIDEWSLLLDLKILVRTVPAVLRGVGAA